MTDTTDTTETTATGTEGDTAVTEALDSGRDFSQQVTALAKPRALDVSKTTGATKALQIVILSEVLTGEHVGKLVRFSGLLNPEKPDQHDRAVESLKVCCAGKHTDTDPLSGRPKGFGKKDVSAVLVWEDVPATATRPAYKELRAKFLNPATGARNALADDELGAFFKALKTSDGASAVKEGEVDPKTGKVNIQGPSGKNLGF